MFNPTYCRYMARQSAILATAYFTAALIFAAICCVILYAASKQFQWEFVWIHLISITLACWTRANAIKEWRTRKTFLRYHRDATEEPRPRCSAPRVAPNIYGQSN
jgi:hypothetical protein